MNECVMIVRLIDNEGNNKLETRLSSADILRGRFRLTFALAENRHLGYTCNGEGSHQFWFFYVCSLSSSETKREWTDRREGRKCLQYTAYRTAAGY